MRLLIKRVQVLNVALRYARSANRLYNMYLAGPGADQNFMLAAYRAVQQHLYAKLLSVAHTEESDTIRIISARVATRAERVLYEEGQN